MISRTVACALAFAGAAAAPAPTVDVVVAHYNEDLSWLEQYRRAGVSPRVYSKGRMHAGAQALRNVGRESHTYLTHIVNNYDRLADWTVFTQGAAPQWGYRGGDSNSGHLTDNITFADYLEPFPNGQDSFLALSTAVRMPQGMQSTRVGILTKELRTVSNDMCPAGGANGWTAWWRDPAHPHAKAGERMLKFYHQHILQKGTLSREEMRPVTLAFVQGARFAMSAKRILSRPLAYYKDLLRLVSHERDPVEGYFVEAMWHDIFHPEAPQDTAKLCELAPLPVSTPLTAKEMYVDTARRLNGLGLAASRVLSRSLSDAYEAPETTEAPTTEAPGTDAPAITSEEPATPETTEAPTTEAPATEAPGSEAPGSAAPGSEAPEVETTSGAPGETSEAPASTAAPSEPEEMLTVSGSSDVGCASEADCAAVCDNTGVFCETMLGSSLAGVGASVKDASTCSAQCEDERRLQDSNSHSVKVAYLISVSAAAVEASGTSLDLQQLGETIQSNVERIDTASFAEALTEALEAKGVDIAPLSVSEFEVVYEVAGPDDRDRDDDEGGDPDGPDEGESAASRPSTFGSSAGFALLAVVSAYLARQG